MRRGEGSDEEVAAEAEGGGMADEPDGNSSYEGGAICSSMEGKSSQTVQQSWC